MPIRLIAGIQGWVCSPAGALAGVSLSCTAPQGPQHNSAVTANTFRSDQRDNHALSFFFDCRGQVGASHLGSSSCASVGVQWPVESSAMVITLESARAVPGHCLRPSQSSEQSVCMRMSACAAMPSTSSLGAGASARKTWPLCSHCCHGCLECFHGAHSGAGMMPLQQHHGLMWWQKSHQRM